ncbi:TetR/AcrR family transcriptional regulator [Kutzneria viridogrisea]|uniref:HTH tetR-type domain-containing protein n=2 Tax=Kutzneria TaxID=43356 RepID=W5W1J9_9PSEU|nr:TetR/AcrR family transcriptional regulator [Kutzneria albida]AHH94640.1 hypothetical protein KALB_1267 [Kutzneria albida DSM 43870]MBA8930308.1 AcrR family transcriptional regulator [Kutzneria viridogrisea]
MSEARQRLLDGAVRYFAEHGVGELSLRALAAELGTSHRMLIYHFGSREGLLVEVVRAVEQRQRELLAELDGSTCTDPVELAREFWRRLSAPENWPHIRLFFEVYGQALQGRPGTTGLLEGIVDSWLAPSAELARALGVPPDQALANARLQVAVARGLLLDLVATGDRGAVDEAAEQFVAVLTAWARRAP